MNKELGSVSNQDDDGEKIGTNLHMWQRKTQLLHALHPHFSQPFLLFPRPELICCAVMWTTGAHGDKFSILFSYLQTADTNLIPGYLECILLAYWLGMTWLSSTSLFNLLIVSYLCDTHYNSIVKKWNSMNFPWLKFGYNDILLRVQLHVKIAFLLLLFTQWRECHTGIHHIISSYVVRTRV